VKPGRPAVVVTLDKDIKRAHQVSDLQPLYQLGTTGEKLLPTLMFKKTLKLDVGKIKKVTTASEDSDEVVWQVLQKDGDESTLTLLSSVTLDGKKGALVGL